MKNTHQEKLFNSTRNTPTELSPSKVEAMIKDFPTLPPNESPPINTNKWIHLFSLNNLIMLAIPIAIVAVLTLTSTNHVSDFDAVSINELSMDISKYKVPGIQYMETKGKTKVIVEKKSSVVSKKNHNNKRTNAAVNFKQKKRLKAIGKKLILIPRQMVQPPASPVSKTHKSILNNKANQIKPKQTVETTAISSTSDHLKLPNPIEGEFEDEIEMDLKSESNHDVVDVDVKLKPVELPPLSELDLEELIKGEKEEVFTFAAKVVRKSAIKSKGKAALFPVRVKDITMLMLHQELYEQLLLDNIIANENEFVVIQIPKYDMAINGEKLQVPLPTKYLNIIEAYRIRHSSRRVIILSPHTINIGDLVNNEFTGTSVVVD